MFQFIDFLVGLAFHLFVRRLEILLPKRKLNFSSRRKGRFRIRRPALTTTTTQTEGIEDHVENTYVRRLSEAMNSMRKKSSLTDATIVCGKEHFKAHKDVLAKFSPFFEAALTKGWKETTAFQIDLPTVSPRSMEAILSYMYCNKLTNITDEKAATKKLLQDADYLQMHDLVDVCFKFLSEHYLNSDEFYDFCTFLEDLNNDICLEYMSDFLSKHFGDITKSDDFWLLSSKMIKMILRHPNVRKFAMSYVVASVLRWIENDSSRRAECMTDFVELLDMWCPDCLTELLSKHTSRNWSFSLGYRLPSPSASYLQDVKRMPRKPLQETRLVCFKLLHDDDCQHVVDTFNAENGEWSEGKEIPFKLSLHESALTTFGHHIFIFGGEHMIHSKRNPAAKVFEYCPFTNSLLSTELSLVLPVSRAGAGVLYDAIYIVNGVDAEGRRVKSVQCYVPINKTCRSVASTNCGHWMPLVFSYGTFLYTIGSLREEDKVLERYDPIVDQWTIVADIPGPYQGCKATLCGSQLFILKNTLIDTDSSDSQDSRFFVYGMDTKLWIEKEFQDGPENYPWCLVSATASSRPVILALGNNGWMQRYDVDSGEWGYVTQPPLDTSWFISYFFAM